MPNNKSSSFFCKTVKETINQYALAQKGSVITVALSGGADSVALLLSLLELKSDGGFDFSISACHLNHGIRSVTALRDEEFARNLCEKLCVPFYSEKVNIPELCKTQKGSVETVARNERYSFFSRASAHFGGSLIATAHTMSDNAETVLFNITRGTGMDGICGIPPKRDIFIRPLIKLKRADVEGYLAEKSQSYMTDETNSDEEYSRNFLRMNIVPRLKELNPSFEEAVFRLSETARLDKMYFEDKVNELSASSVCTAELVKLPYPVLSRYIREIVDKSDPFIRLSSERVAAIAEAVCDVAVDGEARRISLPHKKCVSVTTNDIVVESICTENLSNKTTQFNIPLSNGKNIINEAFCIFISEDYVSEKPSLPDVIKNEDIVYRLYINTELQSAIIDKGLFARKRAEGDFIKLGGISRKLKKVYSEKHIDALERELLPVICDGNGNIVSTPCFNAPSDLAKAEADTPKKILAFYRAL